MVSVSTYRSPLLDRSGAAEAPDSETLLDTHGVAWHYGNPLVEQRTARTSGAVIDRSHRTVVEVCGPDAATLLQSLLSQKLDDAPRGFSAQALNLDAHGHILHCVDITRTDKGFYVDAPEPEALELAEYLSQMRFWNDATITPTELGILTALAPSQELLPQSPAWATFTRAYDWRGIPRLDIAAERSAIEEAVESLNLPLAGLMAYTAERVKAVEPELAADLDSRAIPHEIPHWIGRGEHLGAVHLHKGCYRGQETVARVENVGRPPRVLVMAQLDGSAPVSPQAGAEIRRGAQIIGRLGTVVDDCDDGPIALALVKRSVLSHPEEPWTIEGVAASVDTQSLPLAEGEGRGRQAQAQFRRQRGAVIPNDSAPQ